MDFSEIAYLLSYDYRCVFLDVVSYAQNCQIHGWKYNRKMMHLFEIMLLAQENEENIESITNGKEPLEFAMAYFKNTYRWRDYFIAMGHFIVLLMFTALLCEFFHPNSSISTPIYLRQSLFMLMVFFALPISRRYNKGKINWGIGLLIFIFHGILTSLVGDISISPEQFFNVSYLTLIVYTVINGFSYWRHKAIIKAVQEKYNHYLRQKQYAQLTNQFHEGDIQTWQELLQQKIKLLKNKMYNLIILGVVLIVIGIFILWYVHLDKPLRWVGINIVLLGIPILYGHIKVYEQKIKNIKSFKQEN